MAMLAVLTGMVLLIELTLRVAGVKYEASLYTEEAERGYALRPKAAGWTTTENENYVRINSDGMYDREHATARPHNVIRIAVIGSSEAESQQVPLEKTFEAAIERQLSGELAECGCRVEVLNFGVPGYGLSQEYLTLRNHVWKYDPQIVILATTASAMLMNTRLLYPYPTTHGTPFYVFENGRLVPDRETRMMPPPDPERLKWRWRVADWMNASRILSLVNEARHKAPAILDRIKALGHYSESAKPASSGDIPADYIHRWGFDPAIPQMRESWAIGNAFFQLMRDDSDRHSSEFWIVTIEMPGEVNPNLANRNSLQERLGLSSLSLADQYIEELGHQDGIKVITLAPLMQEYALSHHVALHGFFNTAFNDGHWNETGHQVAASIIAQGLLRDSNVLNDVAGVDNRADQARTPRGNFVDCGCPPKLIGSQSSTGLADRTRRRQAAQVFAGRSR